MSVPIHFPKKPHWLQAICLLAACLLATTASADSFDAGIKAYENSEYAAALENFQAAVVENETAATRHNLALAYFQLGQPAEAVWQLERALALAPFQSDYHYKLGALRERMGLFADKPKWYSLGARLLPLNGWLTLAAGAFWIFLAACLLPRIAGSRVGLGIKSARCLTLIALLIALPAIWLNLRDRQCGIVVTDSPILLRAAPASAAPGLGNARPGERARVLDRHNRFFKVETESGATGWIVEDSFRKLVQPG